MLGLTQTWLISFPLKIENHLSPYKIRFVSHPGLGYLFGSVLTLLFRSRLGWYRSFSFFIREVNAALGEDLENASVSFPTVFSSGVSRLSWLGTSVSSGDFWGKILNRDRGRETSGFPLRLRCVLNARDFLRSSKQVSRQPWSWFWEGSGFTEEFMSVWERLIGGGGKKQNWLFSKRDRIEDIFRKDHIYIYLLIGN